MKLLKYIYLEVFDLLRKLGEKNSKRVMYLMLIFVIWSVLYHIIYSPKLNHFKTFALGTYVEVTYPEVPDSMKQKIESGIIEILNSISEEMSVYDPNSQVSQLNKYGYVGFSYSLANLINKASVVSIKSSGAFDISVQPLLEIWSKAQKTKRYPDSSEIQNALRKVNYKHIKVGEEKIFFQKPGMKINLGGIAKGYAIDLIAVMFKRNSMFNALINIGGDIRVLGSGPKYKGWKLGIAHPREKNKHISVINLKNSAIATSGDYERYYYLDGKRISHIVDPQSGYTVSEVPLSVSVIAPSAVEADAYATAVYVLGPKKGLQMVNEVENISCMIVDGKGQVSYSNDWKYSRIKRL